MKAKVLKHKRLSSTFGQVINLLNHTVHIWPTNIPDLFPCTTTISTLKEINKNKIGDWEKQLEDYEMIDIEIVF